MTGDNELVRMWVVIHEHRHGVDVHGAYPSEDAAWENAKKLLAESWADSRRVEGEMPTDASDAMSELEEWFTPEQILVSRQDVCGKVVDQ